jgi:hypothetical protein
LKDGLKCDASPAFVLFPGIFIFNNIITNENGRKLRNYEFHNAYSSPNIIRMNQPRKIRWAGNTARRGTRNTNKVSMAKPEGKALLGRPSLRWENNIKMNLTEI